MGTTPKRRNKPIKPGWRKRFLAELAKYGTVIGACKKANITRAYAATEYKRDLAFATAWDEAVQACTESIEAAAVGRARDGVNDKRRYSDGLVPFLLKGMKPEKYSDRLDIHLPNIDEAIEQLFARLGLREKKV